MGITYSRAWPNPNAQTTTKHRETRRSSPIHSYDTLVLFWIVLVLSPRPLSLALSLSLKRALERNCLPNLLPEKIGIILLYVHSHIQCRTCGALWPKQTRSRRRRRRGRMCTKRLIRYLNVFLSNQVRQPVENKQWKIYALPRLCKR